VIRKTLSAVILASAIAAGVALTAQGATAGQAVTRIPARGDAVRLTRFQPDGTPVRLTGAALATAASHCAAWAANAGFASNGYLAGSLATAVAVALAESNCDPSACFDNTTKTSCTPPGPAGDSVDRGAWQLNSKVPGATSNKCAFSGPCSATAAYNVESQDGTFFAAWVRYQTDYFAGFLPAAQTAVNALRAGTVTSGINGSCLGYPRDRVNAEAILENCGSAAADQIWQVQGTVLRTRGGLCLAARSARGSGPAVLRRCGASSLQRWLAHGDASLDNAGARRCLTDPRGADKPGAVIQLQPCRGARSQTWYRP
jgi:hypothetical protein